MKTKSWASHLAQRHLASPRCADATPARAKTAARNIPNRQFTVLPALFLAGFVSLGLSGCGGSMASLGSMLKSADPKEAEIVGEPGELYKQADGLLDRGSYAAAAKLFEEVDRQHPYAPEARRSIVMAAYAYQRAGKQDQAISAARRYVTLHPGTKEAAMAQNVIASAYYDRINDASRDQKGTRRALKELEILVRRYPDSRYVEKAKNRILIAYDLIAASEMRVGRYYLKRANYLAAVNRFKTVVKEYSTTKHVEEALMRMTEAYMALGIVNEAQTAAALLGHNFPSSPWYKDAYVLLESGGLAPREHKGSWLSRTWASVKQLSPI